MASRRGRTCGQSLMTVAESVSVIAPSRSAPFWRRCISVLTASKSMVWPVTEETACAFSPSMTSELRSMPFSLVTMLDCMFFQAAEIVRPWAERISAGESSSQTIWPGL
ncbi:hypothetical protein D3C78_1495970 [compost metagenome]